LGYIDDVSLLAVGATPQHNIQALKMAHRRAENWAKKHGSVFATSKY
jgi:AICAR transformylase/IMP cyclohydrolase PurH